MAFRVFFSNDIVVEADTPTDLKAVLGIMRKMRKSKKRRHHEEAEEGKAPMTDHSTDEDEEDEDENDDEDSRQEDLFPYAERVSSFLELLIHGSKQQTIIDLLKDAHPKGWSDVDFRGKLEIQDNRELGHLMTALSKKAKKCGLGRVINKKNSRRPGHKYAYFLADELAQALK